MLRGILALWFAFFVVPFAHAETSFSIDGEVFRTESIQGMVDVNILGDEAVAFFQKVIKVPVDVFYISDQDAKDYLSGIHSNKKRILFISHVSDRNGSSYSDREYDSFIKKVDSTYAGRELKVNENEFKNNAIIRYLNYEKIDSGLLYKDIKKNIWCTYNKIKSDKGPVYLVEFKSFIYINNKILSVSCVDATANEDTVGMGRWGLKRVNNAISMLRGLNYIPPKGGLILSFDE